MGQLELDQNGYLSSQKYKVLLLSEELSRYYLEATTLRRRSWSWGVLADRGRIFPLALDQAGSVDLNTASGADIASLIKYFAYRNKIIEDILVGMKWEPIG